jgi:ABC-type glycerol-3-phosphate transport system substrate-binding protein
MAMGDKLKAFAARGRSKSSNLYQNEDLMEELGYTVPKTVTLPVEAKQPATPSNGFMQALAKAVSGRKKKPAAPMTGYGATRG